MAKKYIIKTYGCQMNYSDSERVAGTLEDIGMVESKSEKEADIIIFNTCSIRQKAEDKVYGQMLKMQRLRKNNTELIVSFTGCMVKKSSHVDSNDCDQLIKKVKGLDLVFRINEMNLLPELLREMRPDWFKEDLKQHSEYESYFQILPKYEKTFQAFVPIMTGCDKFCSYCIVPFTRGREQSREMEDILHECRKLVENGCKEITLLGQNVNSYGLSNLDFNSGHFNLQDRQKMGLRTQLENPPFVQLLNEVNKLKDKGLRRIRYTSSHPYDMSLDLIDAHARLEALCEYIHLPVQSGDDKMLRLMNRHYTVEHYLYLMSRIKKLIPTAGISTDIIVGFSGETEEMFQNTVRLVQQVRWNMIYFAKYSVRKGTLGEKIADDVSHKEKSRRWHIINELLKEISVEKHQRYLGQTVNVLVETCEEGLCKGRTREFFETHFRGSAALIGEEVDVLVTDTKIWTLEGEMLKVADSTRFRATPESKILEGSSK